MTHRTLSSFGVMKLTGTARSALADWKPQSPAVRKPCASGSQNESGSSPRTPR
jgi:hypothetical protein